MSDEQPIDAKYRTLRKGLRSRRRDDPALDLFRQAEANLDDVERVDRILLELGKCYNPLTNSPIVSLASRQRVIALLKGNRTDEAQRLLDECVKAYAPPSEHKTGSDLAHGPGELPLPSPDSR
jgi:hypothetical protein